MIAIGCDHGGIALKNLLAERLRASGYEMLDCGVNEPIEVDYPIIAQKVCDQVTGGSCEWAILVCGTGIGMSMAANKLPGIRCALCADCFSAKMAKAHNDANVIALGARTIGPELAWMILETFLRTEHLGGKHAKRVCQIMNMNRD